MRCLFWQIHSQQLIEIVFPEFNLIFDDLYNDLALNFIHDFPHPSLFIDRRIDYLMNYLKDKNGTTQAFRFKNKVLKMKELASTSLCFVCFDSFQVQNLVQVIELIQFHKSEINKIKDLLNTISCLCPGLKIHLNYLEFLI